MAGIKMVSLDVLKADTDTRDGLPQLQQSYNNPARAVRTYAKRRSRLRDEECTICSVCGLKMLKGSIYRHMGRHQKTAGTVEEIRNWRKQQHGLRMDLINACIEIVRLQKKNDELENEEKNARYELDGWKKSYRWYLTARGWDLEPKTEPLARRLSN